MMTQAELTRLKDYPLNEWMEAADGCQYCKAKTKVMVTWVDESGDFGEVHIQHQHEDDCLDQEQEFGDHIDVAGWEFNPRAMVVVAGRAWTPLKACANVGPCLNCGALVVGVPLILFLDEGWKGELDFCWNCSEELGLLDTITGGH